MNDLVIRSELDRDEFEWTLSENLIRAYCASCRNKILVGDGIWRVYEILLQGKISTNALLYCGRCASGFLRDVTSAEVYPADATAPVRDDGEIGFFNDTWLEYPHPNPWRYDLYDEATGRTAPVTQANVRLLRHGQAMCVGTHLYRLEDIEPDRDGDEMAWVGFVLNSKGEGDEIRFRWSLLPKG